MRGGLLTLKSMAAIGTAILLLLAVLGYILLNRQTTEAANGDYFNSCCGVVRIRGKTLIANGESIPIRQTVMKFGLTVYPSREPSLFRGPKPNATVDDARPLLFSSVDQPSYFVTTDAALREYKFQRVQSH